MALVAAAVKVGWVKVTEHGAVVDLGGTAPEGTDSTNTLVMAE